MNNENELDIIPINNTLITLINHAYLLDYDPVGKYLYFAECSIAIRSIIMACPKTRGIFRISLNQSIPRKEVGNFL